MMPLQGVFRVLEGFFLLRNGCFSKKVREQKCCSVERECVCIEMGCLSAF